jgi:hypothetical protein
MIKRWQTRMAYRELLLKEQVVKSSSGLNSFNAIDFAVEYYYRSFAVPNEYYNYLYMNDVSGIKNGTRLFMGPSTDTDNLGTTEAAVVSHISTDTQGKQRVWLTAPLQHQYADGDLISFYEYVYIYTKEATPSDDRKGALIKLDAYDWKVKEKDTKEFYKKVTASRWCPSVAGIASIVGTNMLFVRPYDSYQNWKSMFLHNVKKDKNTIFPVYDVVFDQTTIYKLQQFITLADDTGKQTTWNWDFYNFQQDTLAPYSSSIAVWTDQSILTGFYKNVDIQAQVRDQFHIGLRDVDLNFHKDGDTNALFDPLDGYTTTDLNGRATVNYRSGFDFKGNTDITIRGVGASPVNGSEYTWGATEITSLPTTDDYTCSITSLTWFSEKSYLRQLPNDFMLYVPKDTQNPWQAPTISMWAKSFFTSPGGDWGNNGPGGNKQIPFVDSNTVKEFLPALYRGDVYSTDGPPAPEAGYGFSSHWPWNTIGRRFFIGDMIKITENFSTSNNINSLTDYYYYEKYAGPGKPSLPVVIVIQPDESGNLQISQLKLSLHTHWVDGQPQDSLWTYVNINQFVFVEDAVPAFWSEKNPTNTNIWIRLRPFAFSLNNKTFRMWVRVDSYLGDTGYYEVTDEVDLVNFDAGGNLLGIEATYNPPEDFPFGALVFVRIVVYDTAYIPNFIYTEYWFEVSPDYASPYLTNLSPSRGEMNVSVDKEIYFEIIDEGTGIDYNSLECLLNSRLMDSEHLTVEKVSRYHAKVTYKPANDLYFNKDYKIAVKVQDASPQENTLNDSYKFYTAESTGVYITDPDPALCKRGMQRFESVSAVILADGNGVDKDSIKMQVYNRDVHPNVVPIVYRVG